MTGITRCTILEDFSGRSFQLGPKCHFRVFFCRRVGAPAAAGTEGGDAEGALARTCGGPARVARRVRRERRRGERAYRVRHERTGACSAELGLPARHRRDGREDHDYDNEHRIRGCTHSRELHYTGARKIKGAPSNSLPLGPCLARAHERRPNLQGRHSPGDDGLPGPPGEFTVLNADSNKQ